MNILACIAGVGMCLMTMSCMRSADHRLPVDDPLDQQPTHVSYNVRVTFMDSTRRKAVLQSTVARVWEDRQETTLGDTVIVDFFSTRSATPARVARITADSAIIDDRTKNMTAIGHVVVWSDSSRTSLTTPRLVWDQQRARLSSTEAVTIVSPKETIRGIGFESDQYLTNYRIFRVTGVHQ